MTVPDGSPADHSFPRANRLSDDIVQIDPATGKVVAFYDFSSLYPSKQRTSMDQVLNGIAYDAAEDVFYLTGKWWPKFYKGACGFDLKKSAAIALDFLPHTRLIIILNVRIRLDQTAVKICGLIADEPAGVCSINSAGGK